MPSVTIGLPAALTSPRPPHDYDCDARTVGEALRQLGERAPQYASRLFYGERLLVVVSVNGRHVPPGRVQDMELSDGDRIDVLPPVAGG